MGIMGEPSDPATDRPGTTTRRGRLRELSAPGWLLRLVRPRPAPIPWPSVVRAAVAVGGPLAVGDAVGQLGIALFISMGALSGAIGDRRGPYRLRAAQIGLSGVAGACGLLLGELVHGRGWASVAVLVAFAAACAVVSVLGTLASTASLQALIFAIVAASRPFPPPLWLPPLLYASGAGWALLLALVGLLRDSASPERRLVAGALRALADLADAIGTSGAEEARRALTDALNKAYDALLSGRARAGGRNPAFRRFMAILNRVTPLVEVTVAAMRAGRRLSPDIAAGLRELADALVERRPAATLPLPVPGGPAGPALDETGPAALALRQLADLLTGGPPKAGLPDVARRSVADRARAATDRMISGRPTWFYALRLALCIGIAETFTQLVVEQRSYWVVLTVAIVLKPDFGSVFARAVQRGLGTVLGVLLGAGILAVVAPGPALVACVAVLAAVLPAVIQRHYGIFSVFVTPLVILLIDTLDPHPGGLLQARLVDTLIGCGIVLVFGYLLWPQTFRSRVGQSFATAVDELASYTRTALVPGRPARGTRRRTAYRRLSDLRTVFQQALAEPPPVSSRAAAWWPAIVAMERLADAVTGAAIRLDRGAAPPGQDAVDRLADAVQNLADVVRERGPVSVSALPDEAEPVLGDVAVEVATARAVLSGPG